MSCDLLTTSDLLGWVVGSLDEFALLEGGAGADQRDEVGRVDGTPAGLCGLDELEGHGHSGGPGAGAFGDPLPQPHGRERGLDRIGGAQVDPVLGGHNFVANGIAVHNSIEQDADMVILLHREEAYEKETQRAGEADLIVAKHRNGPTDTIVVAFQGHYSRFTNMAQPF